MLYVRVYYFDFAGSSQLVLPSVKLSTYESYDFNLSSQTFGIASQNISDSSVSLDAVSCILKHSYSIDIKLWLTPVTLQCAKDFVPAALMFIFTNFMQVVLLVAATRR